MNDKNEKTSSFQDQIHIDYENIDVEDIMNQIKKKILSEKSKPSPEKPSLTEKVQPDLANLEIDKGIGLPEISRERSKAKNLLLKIMKPFAPIIKLLILPVHENLMDTVHNLHRTNMRLDFLTDKIGKQLEELSGQISRGLDDLSGRIGDVDYHTSAKIDTVFDELSRVRDYIKLLHNLSHNMVIELTKLKIEEENLKIKSRIMEKDFEFLGRREKALEKRVLK